MSKFLNIQCQISRIRYPQFAKKWINIRKSYRNFYKVQSSIVFIRENIWGLFLPSLIHPTNLHINVG